MPVHESYQPPHGKPATKLQGKRQIRGGFVVIRRGDSSHRLTMTNPRPYELGSLESAWAEAERLAARHGHEFAVFQEVCAATPPAPAGGHDNAEVGEALS